MPKSIGLQYHRGFNWSSECALNYKGGAHEHPSETENDKWDTPWSCGPDRHVQTEAIRQPLTSKSQHKWCSQLISFSKIYENAHNKLGQR